MYTNSNSVKMEALDQGYDIICNHYIVVVVVVLLPTQVDSSDLTLVPRKQGIGFASCDGENL